MSLDLKRKTNIVVTVRGDVLTADGRDYDALTLAALVQKLEELGLLGINRTPVDQIMQEVRAAAERGDTIAVARGLVAAMQAALPWCGVKQVARGELTDMRQRQGLAPAIHSIAQVVANREPPSPERDAKIKELEIQAARAEVFDLLRESFDSLDRQVGGNEVGMIPTARLQIADTVEQMRPLLLNDPLLAHDLAPAIDYLSGAAQRAKKSRRRNQANRQGELNALRNEVLAEGREAGRREALAGISDRLTNALKDK